MKFFWKSFDVYAKIEMMYKMKDFKRKKIQTKVSKGIGIVLAVLLLLLPVGCAGYNGDNPADAAGVLQAEENGSADAEVSAFSVGERESSLKEELVVRFLDVGQGSAALIQQGDSFMLIDGGDREYSSFVVSYLKKLGITELEYVIVSHYDADHLNGIIGVLNAFACKRVLAPDYETDTKIYRSFLDTIKEKKISLEYPEFGAAYSFAQSSLLVVGPVSYEYADGNANSIGIRISYEDNSFLICGDCTEEAEQDILYAGENVESDVFAANHHGSQYSNCQEFMEAVNPEAVVISCGRDNSYGHPAPSVLLEIQKLGAGLYRTDLQGTITAVGDGSKITFENEVCMDYRSGPEIKSSADVKAEAVHEMESGSFVLNTNTKKFHLPDCSSIKDIKDKNKESTKETREYIIEQGYSACKRCNP